MKLFRRARENPNSWFWFLVALYEIEKLRLWCWWNGFDLSITYHDIKDADETDG